MKNVKPSTYSLKYAFDLDMGKPPWLKRTLAIVALVLYTFDTGSDTYVGVDLVNRCHDRYAASVFAFVCIPGFLLGGWILDSIFNDNGQVSGKARVGLWILGTLFGPILLIICSILLLFKAAWDIDDSDIEGQAKM